MSSTLTLNQIQEAVTQIATGFNASKADEKVDSVALFGSYASNTAHENSDIDLLIKFNSAFVSLFVLGRLMTELEDALQAPVDLVTAPLPEQSFLVLEKVIPLYER